MHPHTRKALFFLAALAVLGLASRAWLSRGPDFELSFERQVRSPLSIEALQQELANTPTWQEWHFNVQRVEATSSPSTLRFFLEPPKKEWKRFELDLQVEQKSPNRIESRVLQESKGRLEKLLSTISWSIQLLPDPEGQGTLIRGEAHARTQGPKARMLGRVVPRIVMNQVFYPDLEALAHPEKRRGQTGEKHDGRLLPF
jgi:hypothetical protein